MFDMGISFVTLQPPNPLIQTFFIVMQSAWIWLVKCCMVALFCFKVPCTACLWDMPTLCLLVYVFHTISAGEKTRMFLKNTYSYSGSQARPV
jgi:hypothetical protein